MSKNGKFQKIPEFGRFWQNPGTKKGNKKENLLSKRLKITFNFNNYFQLLKFKIS